MKKLSLPLVFFVASIINSAAFAKTEGSYVGLDLLRTETSFVSKYYLVNQSPATELKSKHGSSYGLGLNYKYAVNFNGFFIAPGVIFEQNGSGSSATNGVDGERLQAKNRYGVKADLGYDFNKIAPYLTVGLAGLSYKARAVGRDGDNNIKTAVNTGFARDVFYGAGLKIDYSKNISFNIEYNLQRFTVKTQVPGPAADYYDKVPYKTKMEIIKLGLAYNF